MSASRRGLRILGAVGLVLAIGGLFGAVTAQLRSAIEADTTFVAAERQGVAYLRPLTRLVASLADAQSAAVRDLPADTAELNAVVAAVSDVDKKFGAALRTQQRWADLRAEIEKVLTEKSTRRAAMDRFTDIVTLAKELARDVGDTSKLILDPELDSFYLMDAALLQLPIVLTAPGQAAAYNYLSVARDAENGDLVDAAVARHQTATATEAIDVGLRKAMDATAGAALGPGLTEQLDVFRSTVDRVAAPAALRQATGGTDPDTTFAVAQQVRDQGLSLAGALLGELDNLLTVRQDALHTKQVMAFATAAVGVVLGVLLLWWSLPARGRQHTGGVATDDQDENPLDVASVSVQLPTLDARDLLAFEELVHVGRGVRARPKDEADNAR